MAVNFSYGRCKLRRLDIFVLLILITINIHVTLTAIILSFFLILFIVVIHSFLLIICFLNRSPLLRLLVPGTTFAPRSKFANVLSFQSICALIGLEYFYPCAVTFVTAVDVADSFILFVARDDATIKSRSEISTVDSDGSQGRLLSRCCKRALQCHSTFFSDGGPIPRRWHRCHEPLYSLALRRTEVWLLFYDDCIRRRTPLCTSLRT